MLGLEGKGLVASGTALVLRDRHKSCCTWKANLWTQRKSLLRTATQTGTNLQSACPATCRASPTPRSSAASPRVAISAASWWKPRIRLCAGRSMRCTSSRPGKSATQCFTSHIRHVPGCSGTSTGWSRCCASNSISTDRSAYGWLASRSRRKVPACGAGRARLKADRPTHNGVAHWQNASAAGEAV